MTERAVFVSEDGKLDTSLAPETQVNTSTPEMESEQRVHMVSGVIEELASSVCTAADQMTSDRAEGLSDPTASKPEHLTYSN